MFLAQGWATASELKRMHPHDLWLILDAKCEDNAKESGSLSEDETQQLLEMLRE